MGTSAHNLKASAFQPFFHSSPEPLMAIFKWLGKQVLIGSGRKLYNEGVVNLQK